MQIGADIYCDTALICEVLDRMAPLPPLYPADQAAASRVMAAWFDSALFTASVTYTMQPAGVQAMLAHLTPDQIQAFVADRKAMRGDTNALRMPLPEAARCCTRPSRGCRNSSRPACSMWLARCCRLQISRCTTTSGSSAAPRRWRRCSMPIRWSRVVCAHAGLRTRQGARDTVRMRWPMHLTMIRWRMTRRSSRRGFAAGDAVTVTPTDYAKDPVAGVLMTLTADVVTIRRQDPRAGAVNVHFPRQHYQYKRHRHAPSRQELRTQRTT
jgi:glutathione S-transferase